MPFSTDMLPKEARKIMELIIIDNQSCISYLTRGFYGDIKEKIKVILNDFGHEKHRELAYKFQQINELELKIQELVKDE